MTGYGAVPIWLAQSGHSNLIMPFTFAALLGMGLWVWKSRNADRWLLLGGLALMARLWAYHQLYDDMLNLLAFVALLRLAGGRAGNTEPDRAALVVLLIAMTTIPGPATPLRFPQGWLSPVLSGWQTGVRLLMLGVIVERTWANASERNVGTPDAANLARV
jgi:hypothetical protein